MISNQIKYKWQNNNIEITVNILLPMAGDRIPKYQYHVHDISKWQFLVTIEHMVKYLVWKRIKNTKQNKATNFWILQMQFCADVVSIMIYVLMAVPFNPEWNSQLLITINHTSGFLFLFLYFHKFNGGFKDGNFFNLDFISSVLTFQGECLSSKAISVQLKIWLDFVWVYGMLGALQINRLVSIW